MLKIILVILTLLGMSVPSYAEGTLYLLIDVSKSVDIHEFNLQMDAYRKILAKPQMAISFNGVIIHVVMFSLGAYELTEGSLDKVLSDFNKMSNDDIYQRMGHSSTCISDALIFVLKDMNTAYGDVVIDVSGDGEENCGSNPSFWAGRIQKLRDELYDAGVTINTLPIISISEPKLPIWYKENLTTKDGFTIPASNFKEFERALRMKLFLEIASLN